MSTGKIKKSEISLLYPHPYFSKILELLGVLT